MTPILREAPDGRWPITGLESQATPQPGRDPVLSRPYSTPYLEWRDAWTLEVGFMDDDHRALAARLNRLARDYGAGASLPPYPIRQPQAPPLQAALAELARHAREHFQREEDLMRTDGYPGLSDHKSEHDQLLAELSIVARGLRDSGRQWLDAELLDSLKDWLLGHVLEQDRALAEFLKHPRAPEDGGPGL